MPAKKRGKTDTTLCLNFCRYFKPGTHDELACQGFIVVHGMMRRGRKLPLDKPATPSIPEARIAEALGKKVCRVCEFHAADCDFVLSGGAAEPCGGYALLAHLLGSGELKLEELDETAGSAAN